MPLALYLLFLAMLNHRRHPTLMSGPWDFVCVLLGLSGFLLVGGPALLSLFDSTLRSHLFSGNFERLRSAWHANSMIWSTIAASYFALLVGCIVLILMLRRRVTIVYNVDTDAVEGLVIATLDETGIPFQRVVGGFQIGGHVRKKRAILDDDAPAEQPAAVASRTAIALEGQSALLRIEAFSAFQHATLRWRQYDPLLRSEIEAALEKKLAQVENPGGAVGGWLMTAAISLFFVMVVWMGFIIFWIIRQPKAA